MSSVLAEVDSSNISIPEANKAKPESGDHCDQHLQRSKKSVTWKTSDGFVSKTVLREGHGFFRPHLGSACVLDIAYSIVSAVETDSSVNAEAEIECLLREIGIPLGKSVELTLGMAETESLRLLENLITSMREDEESEFDISKIKGVLMHPEIQSKCSSLSLRLTLQSFTQVKPMWELPSEEKYNLALFHKERGTTLFKDGQIEAAFCQYSVAARYLICIPECTSVIDDELQSKDESQVEKYNTLKCICHLNLAACQAKVENHQSVIENCTHALTLDSSNVKGLYRRAQAFKIIGKFDEARSDLRRALKIEPQNRAVASLLQSCKS